MNDYVDLTEELQEYIDNYSTDYGAIVDLDAWNTADLMRVIRIVEQVLELRGADYGPSESYDY